MSFKNKKTVIVAMSGGVDSSVAALLLKKEGYRVIGMFMKNWDDDSEQCSSVEDFEDVVRVCKKIDIPYYSVNFVKEYWDNVFSHFIKEYREGWTPNPDILCNREIKFKVLLEKAKAFGADYLATGHYARIAKKEDHYCLLKGKDLSKDQSYFLYAIDRNVLPQVFFPIGDLYKHEVRKIAKEHDLITAQKKDSTGICFIGERKFDQFLSHYVAPKEGNFETLSGKVVGKHNGAAFYTIGQRKGMGIGGPGEPWFVVGKDIEKNIVFVEQGTRHPSLFSDDLIATEPIWINSFKKDNLPFQCTAKIRYRQPDQNCIITSLSDSEVSVNFMIPQRAITPRQSIVFYDQEICLGGALIKQRGLSYYEKGKALPQELSP